MAHLQKHAGKTTVAVKYGQSPQSQPCNKAKECMVSEVDIQ